MSEGSREDNEGMKVGPVTASRAQLDGSACSAKLFNSRLSHWHPLTNITPITDPTPDTLVILLAT